MRIFAVAIVLTFVAMLLPQVVPILDDAAAGDARAGPFITAVIDTADAVAPIATFLFVAALVAVAFILIIAFAVIATARGRPGRFVTASGTAFNEDIGYSGTTGRRPSIHPSDAGLITTMITFTTQLARRAGAVGARFRSTKTVGGAGFAAA